MRGHRRVWILAGRVDESKGEMFLAVTVGTPQTAPSENQYDGSAVQICGADPTLGQVSSSRCLQIGAMPLIIVLLNKQVKSDSADPDALVEDWPAAEKQARLEKKNRSWNTKA